MCQPPIKSDSLPPAGVFLTSNLLYVAHHEAIWGK